MTSFFNRDELVKTIIIQPMLAMYQAPFHLKKNIEGTKLMLENYQKGLKRYSAETLEKAWEKVKEEHKTWNWPGLNDIIQACEKFAPAYEAPPPVQPEIDRTAIAERVMYSDYGQLALREGWARDVWKSVVRTGRDDYDAEDTMKFRDALRNAIEAAKAVDVRKHNNTSDASLWTIWEAIQAEEEDLAAKYLKSRAA